jgi:hypothetical protein
VWIPAGAPPSPTVERGEARYRLLGELPALTVRGAGAVAAAGVAASGVSDAVRRQQRVAQRYAAREAARKQREARAAGVSALSVELGAPAASASAGAATLSGEPTKGGATDVPARFLCALSGSIMRDPVRIRARVAAPAAPAAVVAELGELRAAATGGGDAAFERDALRQWLTDVGHIHPLSGVEVREEDVVADDALRTDIAAWSVQRAVQSAAPGADAFEGDELYRF